MGYLRPLRLGALGPGPPGPLSKTALRRVINENKKTEKRRIRKVQHHYSVLRIFSVHLPSKTYKVYTF